MLEDHTVRLLFIKTLDKGGGEKAFLRKLLSHINIFSIIYCKPATNQANDLYYSGENLLEFQVPLIGILNFVLNILEVLEIYRLNAICTRINFYNINYNIKEDSYESGKITRAFQPHCSTKC